MIEWKIVAPIGIKMGYMGKVENKDRYFITHNLMTGHHVIYYDGTQVLFDKLLLKKIASVAQQNNAYVKLKKICENHLKELQIGQYTNV